MTNEPYPHPIINDVYEEFCFGKWCLKYQQAGKPLIIVTDIDKSLAYEKLKKEIVVNQTKTETRFKHYYK